MLPFCGYNIGDYFQHWLRVGAAREAKTQLLPRIYMVNWFRKDASGRFMWPGFGDNVRVLKWIVERIEGTAHAVDTPIGLVPMANGIDRDGLAMEDHQLSLLLNVDTAVWRQEAALSGEYLASLGDRVPAALKAEQRRLSQALADPVV